MEFTWRGSTSLGPSADVKGFVLSKYGNYGPPPGFCYEFWCTDDVWQDNPDLEDFNVPEMVERFVQEVRVQAEWFEGAGPGGDIMLTMGSDFMYGAAPYWFSQLDRLIKHVNADGRLNCFYSTPGTYLDAKKAQPNMTWPLKSDDFLPYASDPHKYWTGYYTSRPTLKGYIRESGSYLRAARQMDALLAPNTPGSPDALRLLAEAAGVAQHHDAVSGTAKQHVTNDYAKRLSRGRAAAARAVETMLSSTITLTEEEPHQVRDTAAVTDSKSKSDAH